MLRAAAMFLLTALVLAAAAQTASLKIYVVDDEGKPIDRYVESVEIKGQVHLVFYKSPAEAELPPGTYEITVKALGKQARLTITLAPGSNVTVKITVPGTAGIHVEPQPSLPLYTTLVAVTAALAAVLAYAAIRKRIRKARQGG
ncbi:MAG: carboxypeptidase-like regulatory domain-containing protein [Pyrobaculum sp.]